MPIGLLYLCGAGWQGRRWIVSHFVWLKDVELDIRHPEYAKKQFATQI